MKLHDLLPAEVLENLRQRQGFEPDDESHDEMFDDMSLTDVIEEYLSYEGIIGYGSSITQAVIETLVAFKEVNGLDIYNESQRNDLLY